MTNKDHPIRILFLVDGNADIAAMAASLLEARSGSRFEVYSAGIAPAPISAWASKVMQEIGIEITAHPAVDLSDYVSIRFAHVITLCEHANNSCLSFQRDGHITHWQLDDPSTIEGNDERMLTAYRQARDALAVRVEAWLLSQSFTTA